MADDNDVTGHVDHLAAVKAAPVIRRTCRPMGLAWTVTRPNADALNAERGTALAGRTNDLIDFRILGVALAAAARDHHAFQPVRPQPLCCTTG